MINKSLIGFWNIQYVKISPYVTLNSHFDLLFLSETWFKNQKGLILLKYKEILSLENELNNKNSKLNFAGLLLVQNNNLNLDYNIISYYDFYLYMGDFFRTDRS